MKTYDENSSYEEKAIDLETGEVLTPAPKKTTNSMRTLLNWGIERRGSLFPTPMKQFAAFKRAKTAKITPDRLMARWEEMERDKFWREKGFDWADVVNSFNKRP
jgi:hypothetical protein